MPLVSEKWFTDSNQVFELPKTVLLFGLHQRTVRLFQFGIRFHYFILF